MKIFIGCDHAGFELKQVLVPFLRELGNEVYDKGAHEFNPEDDYPDFIIPVAREVAKNSENCRGIIIGGSGQGEAMAANRFHGVRAAVFNGQYEPRDGRAVPQEIVIIREHNNSNILSLGARFLSVEEVKSAVELWLKTPFTLEERHSRRLKKLEELSA